MRMIRSISRAAVVFSALILLPPSAGAAEDFPRPASLEPAIAFWSRVFVDWAPDQIVYFDGRDLSRIYELRRLPPADGTQKRERVRDELRARWKQNLKDELLALAGEEVDYDRLTGRALRLHLALDASRDPEVYLEAADNLRSQRGIRDAFRSGVARSARYKDAFRRIFREEGVPEDLVYLPHVESSYRWNARSSVGALGMWQFMPSTARRYMKVDRAVDERLDPYTAARGSAGYLKRAYERLGTWPLAITSYNHGVDGIKNAVRETGTTDIAHIIETYRGPMFGFAGRNFYPEFLAAKQMADSLLADPGSLELDEPVEFVEFELPAYVKMSRAAKAFNVSADELRELNPAIKRAGVRGEVYLTKGYRLKLPPTVTAPSALFASLPATERPATPPKRTYRVRRGDSLGSIAARHRTSIRTLQRLNGIRNPNHLRAGMLLKLPF